MIAQARLAVALAFGLAALGCSFAPPSSGGKSPLSPFRPGLETSALEVVFVRHAYELPALNEDLWSQVDETSIAPDARQALAQNGMRVGVISGQLPLALEAAMSLDEPASGQAGDEAPTSPTVGQLESESLVRRRMLHTLPGQRAELLASGIYERLPLLVRDGDEGRGNIYNKAQCVIAAKAIPLGDHRIRLLLVPEIQHGEARREIHGDDGIFRFDSARPKVAFDKMAIEVVLSPGQAVVCGARTERPGSIGHYFFTEPQAGQLEQKLMLIRFEGTEFDNLLLGDSAGQVSDTGLAR